MANLSPSRLRGTRAPRGRGDIDELCRWIPMQQATPAYTEDRQDDKSDVASTPQCQPATCRAGVSRPMALPIGHEARPISPSAASTLQFGRWHAGINSANSCILMMSENESETSMESSFINSNPVSLQRGPIEAARQPWTGRTWTPRGCVRAPTHRCAEAARRSRRRRRPPACCCVVCHSVPHEELHARCGMPDTALHAPALAWGARGALGSEQGARKSPALVCCRCRHGRRNQGRCPDSGSPGGAWCRCYG